MVKEKLRDIYTKWNGKPYLDNDLNNTTVKKIFKESEIWTQIGLKKLLIFLGVNRFMLVFFKILLEIHTEIFIDMRHLRVLWNYSTKKKKGKRNVRWDKNVAKCW